MKSNKAVNITLITLILISLLFNVYLFRYLTVTLAGEKETLNTQIFTAEGQTGQLENQLALQEQMNN